MKLFEYEAKEVMASYGLPVPESILASNLDEVITAVDKLGPPVMLKAQVLVGGRGKAGGVKPAFSKDEAKALGHQIFSLYIKGEKVERILVEKMLEIEKEYFLAITIDRAERKPVVLASTMGGVDVEEAAREHPEAVVKSHVDPRFGLHPFQARRMAKQLGLDGERLLKFADVATKMYKIFDGLDAELVETNPIVLTRDGKLVLADARLNLVDDALFRHKEFQEKALERLPESTELERLAKSKGVTLVDLGGEIGVIGNGAGLTMATIDLVLHYKGRPACFLDVGGGATPEEFVRALQPLIEHPRVKVILINILGGITRCDEVAKGIKKAYDEISPSKPLVVRLSGTNEEEGRRILDEVGIKAFASMNDAAIRAVELSR